jgi:hypothetical protein
MKGGAQCGTPPGENEVDVQSLSINNVAYNVGDIYNPKPKMSFEPIRIKSFKYENGKWYIKMERAPLFSTKWEFKEDNTSYYSMSCDDFVKIIGSFIKA